MPESSAVSLGVVISVGAEVTPVHLGGRGDRAPSNHRRAASAAGAVLVRLVRRRRKDGDDLFLGDIHFASAPLYLPTHLAEHVHDGRDVSSIQHPSKLVADEVLAVKSVRQEFGRAQPADGLDPLFQFPDRLTLLADE